LKRYIIIITFTSINMFSKLRDKEGSLASITWKSFCKIAQKADYMMVI